MCEKEYAEPERPLCTLIYLFNALFATNRGGRVSALLSTLLGAQSPGKHYRDRNNLSRFGDTHTQIGCLQSNLSKRHRHVPLIEL